MTMPVYRCARCGHPFENGSVLECAIVSDVEPDDPGAIRTLRFCRDRDEDGQTVKGCVGRVFTAKALAHHLASKDTP